MAWSWLRQSGVVSSRLVAEPVETHQRITPAANCNDMCYTHCRLESAKIRLDLAIFDGLGLQQMLLQFTPAVSLLHQEVEMNFMEDIANVIRIGGCVVMGVGVAPEKYRLLLEGATSQNYLLFGARDSKDADYIASRMSGELLVPSPSRSWTWKWIRISSRVTR